MRRKLRGSGRKAALLAALLVPASAPTLAREALTRESRITLIRGLAREIAVTKITLPRGKHGVFLDEQGRVDRARADDEVRANGPAVRPGMPVEITRIAFRTDRIVFEINGGGRKGKKWYQRIEIGVGGSTQPIVPENQVLVYGSWITLKLSDKNEELSVAQVKKLLANAMDFERHSPTVLYTASVPPKIKEAIKNHQVVVGMDHDAVLSAKGPPERKVREVRDGAEQEDWIYGLPPHVLFVTFDGDTVVAVRQY